MTLREQIEALTGHYFLRPDELVERQAVLDIIDAHRCEPHTVITHIEAHIDRDALARADAIERVAAFLHDEYGCRITCRGGRLADDRHPSHNEAYRDQAERLVAATWTDDEASHDPA